MIDISSLKSTADDLKTQYKLEAKAHKPHRIFQDYNTEQEQMKQYCGREILELLQNADDAHSSTVELTLNPGTHELTIKNSGPDTILFTEEGFNSLMYAHSSPKKGSKIPMIGNKGLGFRSILNWATKISIESDNVHVDFAPEFAMDFWNNHLAKHIQKPPYITNPNQVPLAILALPDISPLPTPKDSTSIKLIFKESMTDKIIDELRHFKSESLLFLHHINEIIIIIDNEKIRHKNVVHSDTNGVRTSTLDGRQWICVHQEGVLNIEGEQSQQYEVAAAFCSQEDIVYNEPIYCFFPTKVNFDLPCILHATLELDSSRNSLNDGSRVNSQMMMKLSEVIIKLADYLKAHECTWHPYMLLNPADPGKAQGYQSQLFIQLKGHAGEYIPTLSGEYVAPDECYYFTDEIADIINELQGHSIFPNMRLQTYPGYHYRDSRQATDSEIKCLETFTNGVNNYDELARLIIAISQYAAGKELGLHLFRNPDNKTITGRAYINEGQTIDFLPNFLNFDYLSPELAKALQTQLKLTRNGDDSVARQLARILSCIGPISSSDLKSIILNILPTKKEVATMEPEQLEELLKCLFKLYIDGKNDLEGITNKEKPYLLSKDGTWRPANELVLNDRRFPDGYMNLDIKEIYSPEQCAAYPEFLDTIEGSSPESIQAFLLKFGVQKYILTTNEYFVKDNEYLKILKLPEHIKNKCHNDPEGRNTTRVAIDGTIDTLNLSDLIKLLKKYPEYLSERQEIHWRSHTYQPAEPASINYATFKLRQLPSVAPLKFYAVYDREWLPGKEPSGIHFADNADADNLLLKLGAVRTCDDFSPETIYEAINSCAQRWLNTRNDSGIKSFYHKVKQVLAAKNATPPDDLIMLCRIDGELTTHKASEIYYSDNIGVKELRKKLPILELQLRDGEEQVKRCFGCRLTKDLKAIVDKNSLSLNRQLEDEIADKLESLKPYILAIGAKCAGSRGGDNAKQFAEVKSHINSISIRVVASASYHYDGAEQGIDASMTMAEGDLIDFGGVLTICSRHPSIDSALLDPQCVNAIVEAICIKLKLNAAENIDRFFRLLKADARELDFMVSNDFDAGFWDECQEAFGVSDAEVEFWRNVFSTNGLYDIFNPESLKTDKTNFLMYALKIKRDLTDRQGFLQAHVDKLRDEYHKYFGPYLHYLHSSLSQKSCDDQAKYYRLQENFKKTDWCIDAARKIQYELKPNYAGIVAQYMLGTYGFSMPDNPDQFNAPQEHAEYLQGLSVYNLILEDKYKSWLYFDGKEQHFSELRSKLSAQEAEPETEHNQTHSSLPAKIIEVTSSPREPKACGPNAGGKGTSHSYAKPSESKKLTLGNMAEDRVYESLNADDVYEVGAVYSKHLCDKYQLNTADDRKGYDMDYRRKGESLWRCLEIKHSNGQSIIISDNEFQVAQTHPRYDIALFVNGEIRIWRNALSNRDSFTDKIGDHTVFFQLEQAGEEDGGDAGGGHPA